MGAPPLTTPTPGPSRLRLIAAPAVGVVLGWALLLYLVPLAAGLVAGARPLRLISTGIMFDQSELSLNGYRLIVWSPVVMGVVLGALALLRRPTRLGLTLGLVGSSIAATLLTLGGGLGIGPGATLLVGTELRWVWKICIIAAGLAVGLVGPLMIKTLAEDHEIAVPPLKHSILLTSAVLGALILLLAPGPMLGKAMSGAGSWLGSMVWLLAL
ncbi:MAG TPA: hypothetical protein VG940_03885 [Gemmatimonadales bacterium]|nr:hypothetical protein [Gemmatimonadales bacterium]